MRDLNNDIQKYLKGELSPAQMHELEKRALGDPFLADALEGAESIDSASFTSDLETINARVKAEKPGKYLWPLRIAASLLLIASVTYLVVRLDSGNQEQLALQKEVVEDSTTPLLDSAEKSTKSEENLLALKSDKPEAEPVKPKTVLQKSKPREEPAQIKEDLSATNQFALQETDEIVLEEESTVKLDEKIELAIVDDEISDQRIAESRSEDLKARSRALKKEAAPASLSGAGATAAADKTESVTTEQQATIVGSDEYQKYLRDNVIYPQRAIANEIEGEAVITFLVSPDGSLSDFKIEKGIGFGCDEELIRLIKEGPKWTTSSSAKKASVTFLFRLAN
ncbi:MAG: TonB family protein [Cyclobacteriaceae bacterium]